MLEKYGRLARGLFPLRFVFYAGIVVGLGFFAYAIFAGNSQTDGQETRMFLPLVGVLWCVCLAMFTHGFSGDFPTVDPEDGWFRRFLIKLQRGFWHLVALAVIAFGGATALLTVRALMAFGN